MTDDHAAYDIVILGGGSGGYACALRAVDLGKSVALIEKDKAGGTCLHYGCIPTKALLHAAEVADLARDGMEFGIKTTLAGIDMGAVHSYKDGVVNRLHKGLQGTLKSRGVTYVEGAGKLVSPTAVEVDGKRYEGRHVVLATGSQPKWFPGFEPDGERIITSDHALKLDRVPASVVILGAGAIGVEFASIWRSFGADVTIVEALPNLVPLEDKDSSKLLERAFRKRKIAFHTGTKATQVEKTDSGVKVSLENGKELEAELLLVAVGRGPVSAELGYEEQGVRVERGNVVVDEFCRTSVDTISAVGDLIATPQFAHVGFQEGILVAERLAGLDVLPIDYAGIPRITYSDPEVASVGLTSEQAKEKYGEVNEVSYNLAANGKSLILQTQGAVKVIAAMTGQTVGPVVGVHMVGARVGELLAEAQLIYNWEAFPAEVAQFIHGHPSQSEAIGEAHMALAGKPLHFHN